MVVIKGKEKKLDKPAKAHGMTKKAKRILRRPQDCQPVPVVCV